MFNAYVCKSLVFGLTVNWGCLVTTNSKAPTLNWSLETFRSHFRVFYGYGCLSKALHP